MPPSIRPVSGRRHRLRDPYPWQMPRRIASQPAIARWHAIGLIAVLWLFGLYAGKAYFGGGGNPRLYWLLGAAAVLAGLAAWTGRRRGWQERRMSVVAWPVTALVVTTLVGVIAPTATREFPGAI